MALTVDWKLVGQDLREAMNQYEAENPTPEQPAQLALSLGE